LPPKATGDCLPQWATAGYSGLPALVAISVVVVVLQQLHHYSRLINTIFALA
jgi:hypothetical protein